MAGGLSNAASTSTMDMALITSEFECPVCYDYVQAPIWQCPNGHLVCVNCRNKIEKCPNCREPKGNIRNSAMERLSCLITFPCEYKERGCEVLLFQKDMVKHVEACEFQPYSCPYPGANCEWKGYVEGVLAHLNTTHERLTPFQGYHNEFQIMDLEHFGEVDWAKIQSCYDEQFIIVLKKRKLIVDIEQYFAFVQLVGPREQAKKFKYQLKLYGSGRFLSWERNTRSIHEPVTNDFMQSDCLVFDKSFDDFNGKDCVIKISVTIFNV